MSNKKRILTGHVARIVGGVLVTAGPGDAAPDWVTNPNIIADEAESSAPAPAAQTPPTKTAPKAAKPDEEKDDLSDLGIEDLRALAVEAGVAKSGKKTEIAARIRAKRAEAKPAGDAEESNDGDTGDRDALVAKATALGIEDAGDLTDDELSAAIESEEE
ncbi:hypothetical protein ACFY9N_11895 [Microbacterium sp. NPDC008134]|uniref:hypothetical protein n=1 Tax=Microbacterium sp. NPDC008134 TaxID=3364183 RepID=UPI0036E6C02D